MLLLCAGLLSSCVTEQAWIQNDQKIGTIQTEKRPWGTESSYRDLSGRLVRIQRHNRDGQLLAGVCTIQYSYDVHGLLTAEQDFNSDNHLTRNEEGFAACTYAWSSDPDGNRVVTQSFFDENNQPVLTTSGFAILKRTETFDDQTKRIQFYGLTGAPAPSTWLGVFGVVDVQYSVLQGVTPVLCVALLDASGNVIDRRQLSGETSAEGGVVYTTYYYAPSGHHR
jgi:hypothetical protein